MFRSIGSIISGYLALLFLSRFPRIIHALYTRSHIHFSGPVSEYSAAWNYAILGIEFFAAVFAALITATLAGKKIALHLSALAAIVIAVNLLLLKPGTAPGANIFILGSLAVKLAGFLLGYYLKAPESG